MTIYNSIQPGQAKQTRIQSFAFVVSVCVCALLSVSFIRGTGTAADEYEVQLQSRINPNNAPLASMVRLSGIGPARAGAIVAFREAFGKKDDSDRAFRDCNDLQQVKGIGPKTAQGISEWLEFE